MIWEWIRLYLLIGACVIGLEWFILIIGRRRLLESKKTDERIAEVVAFFFEILIWPCQVYRSISCIFKLRSGSLSDEEYEWLGKGIQQGLELRKKWKGKEITMEGEHKCD